MITSQDDQGPTLLFWDLVQDDVCDRYVVVAERCPIRVSKDAVPINWRVAGEHTQTTGRRQFLVDFANRDEPFRINWRFPGGYFGGVAPDMPHLIDRNVFTGDISIKQCLIIAAREFDNDVLKRLLECRNAGQRGVG